MLTKQHLAINTTTTDHTSPAGHLQPVMQQTPTAVRSTNAVYVEMRLQAILCSLTMVFYFLVGGTRKKRVTDGSRKGTRSTSLGLHISGTLSNNLYTVEPKVQQADTRVVALPVSCPLAAHSGALWCVPTRKHPKMRETVQDAMGSEKEPKAKEKPK